MGTMLAAFRYWRSGCMKLWIAGPSALSALAGSAFGARIALMIADTVFKRLMLIILPITALYILRSANIETVRSTYTARKTLLICLVIAFLIGIYDGFYGPGTGTFLLLLLTGFAHLDLDTAAGTTKAVNLASNIAALTVYLSSGKVVLSVGLAAGCFSIAGNYAGTRFYARKRARGVKKMILIVLAIFFIKVGWELFA